MVFQSKLSQLQNAYGYYERRLDEHIVWARSTIRYLTKIVYLFASLHRVPMFYYLVNIGSGTPDIHTYVCTTQHQTLRLLLAFAIEIIGFPTSGRE